MRGEGVASILAGGGHQRYSSTHQNPKGEGGIEASLLNDTHEATSLPSEGPYSTSALPIDTGLGTCVTANPTMWLLKGNHLPTHPRVSRGGTGGPSGCYIHRTLAAPGMASISSSHIMKDELTGTTYMDMVTTSVRRVTISSPGLGTLPTGPTIEDIMDSQ